MSLRTLLVLLITMSGVALSVPLTAPTARAADGIVLSRLTGAPASVVSGAARDCRAERLRLGQRRFDRRYRTKTGSGTARCRRVVGERRYTSWLLVDARTRCAAIVAPGASTAHSAECATRLAPLIAASRRAARAGEAFGSPPSSASVADCLGAAFADAARYAAAWPVAGRPQLFDLATTRARACHSGGAGPGEMLTIEESDRQTEVGDDPSAGPN